MSNTESNPIGTAHVNLQPVPPKADSTVNEEALKEALQGAMAELRRSLEEGEGSSELIKELHARILDAVGGLGEQERRQINAYREGLKAGRFFASNSESRASLGKNTED